MFLTPGRFMQAERVLVLCYTPPSATAHRLADALYHDDAPERRSALRMAIDAMQRVLEQFEDQAAAPLNLRRMQSYLARTPPGASTTTTSW